MSEFEIIHEKLDQAVELLEEKDIDLEEHYFRIHQLFFSLCCAVMIDRTILETVVGNHSIFKLNTDWPRLFGIVLVGFLAVTKNRLVHAILTGIALLLLVVFTKINSPKF